VIAAKVGGSLTGATLKLRLLAGFSIGQLSILRAGHTARERRTEAI
jgi:hypothetical protein